MGVVAAALAGLAFGSFLNVAATRIPAGESVWSPRSHCRACKKPVRMRDLIPILSFLALGGACRDCGARIPFRYPILEAIGAVIVMWAVAESGSDPLGLAPRVLFPGMLAALAATDAEGMVLPDRITLPGILLGIGCAAAGVGPTLFEALFGILVGGGLLLGLRELYLRARGVEALGLGDVKMVGMAGAFLGPVGVLQVIGIGSGLALLAAVPLLLAGRISRSTRIPFGVFLAVAAAIVFGSGVGVGGSRGIPF